MCLCFHLRKHIYSTELQDCAEEIHHMLAISFWSILLPQATTRLRQDDSLPVSSDGFLRQGPNNPSFKREVKETLWFHNNSIVHATTK